MKEEGKGNEKKLLRELRNRKINYQARDFLSEMTFVGTGG